MIYYNYMQVLDPLIQDLLLLEKGIDGLKAGVLLYVGDNLELNEIGGFHRVFSSGNFCRICQIPYRDLPLCDGFGQHALWTPEKYDSICDMMENDAPVENYSLRERCPLNQLAGFHAATSMAQDMMHDFLEGVVATDLLGVIKCLMKDSWFTVEAYNEQLRLEKLMLAFVKMRTVQYRTITVEV
jgi:hypothetical protein